MKKIWVLDMELENVRLIHVSDEMANYHCKKKSKDITNEDAKRILQSFGFRIKFCKFLVTDENLTIDEWFKQS